MKQILILIFFNLSFIAKTQDFELKDKNLIKYYEITNDAENNIIGNNLIHANSLYKEAFSIFKYPHAKDLYNSMKVALKIKDLENTYVNYQTLKCLGQNFSNNFLDENFKDIKNVKKLACQNVIDLKYKKV